MAVTFTLESLESWSHTGTALAVLGHPIKHSISPAMHMAALAEMAKTDARFAAWTYGRFDIPPADLPRALDRLHAQGFHGLNLTVPHKVLAFPRVSRVDAAAAPIGAVNTLRWLPTGWEGFNTDGYGLATAVQETLGLSLTETPVILLGAGGAARGAAVECLQRKCRSLWIGNRTAENLDALLRALGPLSAGIPLHGFLPDSPPQALPHHALLINATSVGLRAEDPPPIALDNVPHPAGVYDMIYNPPVTPLLAAAARAGIPHANGLAMLIHQGVRALEIWSGAVVPADAMRAAAEKAMAR